MLIKFIIILSSCSFGSFFGPSKPIISQRVIQESKSLLENQNLVSKMLSFNQSVSITCLSFYFDFYAESLLDTLFVFDAS